jgi:23S rRNA pseudouridine2605 synthase
VNGAVVSALGSKVSPLDEVRLDGILVKPETRRRYLLLNKPAGYLCTSSDPQGRPLARSLLPPVEERLYNVGRLDFRSSGLIIFTNDGEFARKVGHPASEIEKEYLVASSVPIPDRMVEEFRRGVVIENVFYRAKAVSRLEGGRALRVVLVEGRNREIRRVFAYYHLHVETIQRVRIGTLTIDGLAEGESRPLTDEERAALTGAGGGRT